MSSTRKQLGGAVAYFNMDVAVSGSKFGASAVPTLKQFVRDVTKSVDRAKGRTVYEVWKKASEKEGVVGKRADAIGGVRRAPAARRSLKTRRSEILAAAQITRSFCSVWVRLPQIRRAELRRYTVFDNFGGLISSAIRILFTSSRCSRHAL